MSGRYSAFTFCDRITSYVPARRASARFAIPAGLPAFTSCLVAEATGQLAAWVSMAHIGFRGRPVAALAGETRYTHDVAPGDLLELDVDIEHCDAETVAYSGRATVAGRTVLELADCVGPMLPQDEYDSPDDLAREFDRLRGDGEMPGRFPGVPPHVIDTTEQVTGKIRRATLQVPTAAPFFTDHFPRRPVFPATLLLDAALSVARKFVHDDPALPVEARWRPQRVTNVKMRDFILPGQTVELTAEPLSPTAVGPRASVVARVGERTVATARAEFTAEA